MSGTSSSDSSGLPGNPRGLAKETATKLGAGLAKVLAEAPSGEQSSPPISPPSKTGGGTAFVRSSTREAAALAECAADDFAPTRSN